MRKSRTLSLCTAVVALGLSAVVQCAAAEPGDLELRRSDGLRVVVSPDDSDPVLLVFPPNGPAAPAAIKLLFPEHVTVRPRGMTEVEHLYVSRPGASGVRPSWRRTADSLEYERELPGRVRMRARATLESDGLRLGYEFANRSSVPYDMVYAVSDPRMGPPFRDVRLQRTYVHSGGRFELLAAEIPERLTMPLETWLPVRVLASITWPVPHQRVQRRDDGITYRYRSQKADEPLIATTSTDGSWVVASFAREAGNVWSNPELTCQHVDPETAMAPGQKVLLEVKLLILRGTLDDVQRRFLQERSSLR